MITDGKPLAIAATAGGAPVSTKVNSPAVSAAKIVASLRTTIDSTSNPSRVKYPSS
jgi:hypothetical protein